MIVSAVVAVARITIKITIIRAAVCRVPSEYIDTNSVSSNDDAGGAGDVFTTHDHRSTATATATK